MIKIIIGYVLDLIIGDPNNPYHPIRYIGKLASNMENFGERFSRKILRLQASLPGFL